MNGILLLDKPKGLTSANCVYRLRKILGYTKIGHCGTLDPLATGLLPICIGEATRFSSYITSQHKKYRLSAVLGIITDSGDLDGNVIKKTVVGQDSFLSESIFRQFLGKQQQCPPMYSAIKKKGRPLYSWVRKGIYFKRDFREIEIISIEILKVENTNFELEVVCSKGTYIRSLVESIGKEAKVGSALVNLKRLAIGDVTLDRAVTLNSVNKNNILDHLLPADLLISDIPSLFICKEDAKKVRKGQSVDYNAHQEITGTVKIYEENKVFLGIGSLDKNMILQPKRLFPS